MYRGSGEVVAMTEDDIAKISTYVDMVMCDDRLRTKLN